MTEPSETRLPKVICFLFDPNVGGPTIRARAVYEVMQQDGYTIRTAFPEGEGTAVAYMAEKSIAADKLHIVKPVLPRKPVAFMRFAGTAPLCLWRLRRYLRQERPDVIHVNGAFDILPALAGKLSGVPVVWHLNDTVFSKKVSRPLGKIVKRVADVIVIAATRVGLHYDVMDAGPHVIFAPVNVYRFEARPTEREMNTPARLSLLGNWNWIKGQDRFVEVTRALRERGLDVTGKVAGKFLDGQSEYWKPIMEDIRRDGLDAHIETPGFVADTVGFLNETDVLLLTSHSEASPICVLEAMSIGVPIISFDVGGVQEMLGDGEDAAGIVVPAGDTTAMIQATARLLAEPALCQRLAENGQRRARELFSLEICIQRHKMAYAAAIAGHKGEQFS